jgi:hypothetical protein
MLKVCHIFRRCCGRRWSRTLFIIDWYPSVVGVRLTLGIRIKPFFKHSTCFRRRLAQLEAESDEHQLLLHINHISRFVRSHNNTNKTSKIAKKKHTSLQQKAAWLSNKGYSSRYLVAYNSIRGSFRAEFQFFWLLGNKLHRNVPLLYV